jgi:hypothetical protein
VYTFEFMYRSSQSGGWCRSSVEYFSFRAAGLGALEWAEVCHLNGEEVDLRIVLLRETD